MSFNATVRDELARTIGESEAARRAELAALIRLGGSVGGGAGGRYRIELATENAAVARKVITLAHALYGLKTEFTPRKNMLHKANNYLITIPAQRGLKQILDQFGLIGGSNPHWGIAPGIIADDTCAAAYLRGAFLASGFIADPKGDFHFEISMHNEQLAQAIQELMKRFSIDAKTIQRRNAWTVYLKGTDAIIDFLALVGAHNALLKTEEVRVFKSMRNTVNRQVNAEVANQAKATDAALKQIANIHTIDKAAGIASLPRALQDFARLRLAHPEASLRELGEMAKPTLSKSALNHRVRRLEEIAAKYRA